jgi:hypothetical protein
MVFVYLSNAHQDASFKTVSSAFTKRLPQNESSHLYMSFGSLSIFKRHDTHHVSYPSFESCCSILHWVYNSETVKGKLCGGCRGRLTQ